ncbi:hypothetical protein Q4577_13870 [Marinovum sp. 2_MG-2023]|uniref:hypothetical protein n=1 Tax=Roseobacteraceae TaxID=2854170 RepID=UPI001FD20F46|nr:MULTISPECIES: hypothetical protein [Roseobacteraceae]MCJ7873832.1 hypothetical protein [Phaeobacter sp. J2-8]MDO6731117.1 hypothetical protein [Marinovum sp. 2_MG-2023]MDO6778614.1 hypothetical protein [Marinovum sp. 1_MG-2023]
MIVVLTRLRQRPYAMLGLFGLALITTVFTAGVALRPAFDLTLSWQIVTGALLVTGMAYQWMLLVARQTGKAAEVRRHYAAHRWVGVGMTLLFAVHAVRFGHAWTSVLAMCFIAVAATGLLNREVIPYRSKLLYNVWLWLHIALSSALIPLTALHIWIALTYQ